MLNKKIPVILDGDPGHDDAIAWVVANKSEQLDILAITAVNGNCSTAKAAYNSQRIATLIGYEGPVAKGQDNPLYVESLKAPTNVHGESGLDGPALPEPKYPLSELTAVELMAKLIEESADPVVIIATGPLTNVGALLLQYPHLKSKISHISIMGGGIQFGNWTPAAEFNILVDPESADIVFQSGIHVYMAGLDVTEKALVCAQDVQAIKEIGNPVSEIVWKWLEFFYQFHHKLGYPGAPMHDLCAVMVLIHPEVFTLKDMYVQVETEGDYSKGTTVGDYYGVSGKKANTTVIMDVDREKFIELMISYIKKYSED